MASYISRNFCVWFVLVAKLTQHATHSASIDRDIKIRELKEGFSLHIYTYTAKGWDFEVIDESILKLNMDYLESESTKPYNSSASETILQFPDFAFTTSEVVNNRSLAVLLSQRVPKASFETVPCIIASDDPLDMLVHRLSCMARNMYVYIVAGLLEKVACLEGEPCREDGQKIYSTAVVFDKNGYLVTKKYNLIHEQAFDKPQNLEPATFTTENNFTLGLFMGHDLLFAEPANAYITSNVQHFIYLSGIVNTMPFGFSFSNFVGWTYANQKNKALLSASDYCRPEKGYVGGGLVRESGGYNLGMYHNSLQGMGILVVGVGKARNNIKKAEEKNTRKVVTEGIDFSEYSSVPVPQSNLAVNEVSVCHGEEFCCTLSYRTIRGANEMYYQLVAFEGNRTAPGGTVLFPEQTCGLVACSSEDKMSCGAELYATNYTQEVSFTTLSLQGSFSSDKVIPITMNGEDYFPMSSFDFSVLPNGNRYNANMTFDGSGFPMIKTFALSSTDYTPKNTASMSFTASVIFILMSHIVLAYVR